MFKISKYSVFSTLFCTCFFLFLKYDGQAQLKVKDSLLISQKGTLMPPEVIPNNKNLIIIQKLHSTNNRGDYNIMVYDSVLNVKHSMYWHLDKKYNWWAYDLYKSNILLMSRHKSKDTSFKLSINQPSDKYINNYNIESPVFLDVIDFYSLEDIVFLWGNDKKGMGVVLGCLYKKNKIIVLNKITYQDIKIVNIWADKKENLLYIITKNDKLNTFNIRRYTNEGILLNEHTIRSKKNLLQAKLVSDDKDIYLGGLYSESNKKNPQGIFLYKWSGVEGKIKYVSYFGLKKFFLYLNEKYEKKFRKRQAKRELLGKKIRFSMSASILEIKKDKKLFHLLAECFYEKKTHHKENSNPNSMYYNSFEQSKIYYSSELESMHIYSHAFSVTFDDELNVLYDASISLKGEESESIKNFVSFDDDQEKQIFFRIKDNYITYNVFNKNLANKQSPFNHSEKEFKLEKLKMNDYFWWYEDFFVLTGQPKKFNYGKKIIMIYKILSE